MDPKECSKFYATVDVGKPDGMKMTTCILKEHEKKIKNKPSNDDWKDYGEIQRFLVPVKNAEQCTPITNGFFTLCGTNNRGRNELESINRRFGTIFKKGKDPCEYGALSLL